MKNIQAIDTAAYEAFGFPVQNGSDQVTYYYRKGTTHTTGGGLYYRTFTGILEAVISDPIPIVPFTTENISGVSGGQMDFAYVIIFYVVNHSDGTRDIYMIRGDMDNNFDTPVLFDWNSLSVKLSSGFFYGPMISGDTGGEYYHIMYQTAPSRYRVSIVKTTDYWNTYSEIGVLYDGTIPISETAATNLGGGKFVAISRINNGGGMATFESTNYGVTWTRRPSSNLYWWNGGGPSIPWIYSHDGVFDIPYQCRDASMIEISKGNTLANNFGKATPIYNDQEIYCYHRGTGGNPSLGYVSQIKLSNAKYFMIFSKEYTNTKANLQWTIDDLVTDPNGIPIAPILAVSSVTSTSFRVDITNFGDWQNIRYCTIDLSTQADFSTFVTCKYRAISAYPVAQIRNIRMTGYYDMFNSLTTGTTYYLRIRACNNAGCSDYTSISVTTN